MKRHGELKSFGEGKKCKKPLELIFPQKYVNQRKPGVLHKKTHVFAAQRFHQLSNVQNPYDIPLYLLIL